jgi:hypothetical protein
MAKRGRPKGSKKTELKNGDYDPATDKISKASGTMYLYSNGLSQWADTEITSDTIEQFKRNAYITARFNQLINLIFQDDIILEIEDPDGKPDEEIATKIRKMLEDPAVDINYQARQCFSYFFWHGPYIYNCVYGDKTDEDGWQYLKEIRDLPPKSFDCQPLENPIQKSQLYPGICLLKDKKVHYYQMEEENGTVEELQFVKHAKPPNDITFDIAGMPMVYPSIPILNRLNFAWKCQIQKCNRIGAPSIFIKITDPVVVTDENGNPIPGKRNDFEFSNTILANWGTNTSFAHQSNIEVVPLDVKESDSAMETIHELAKLIVNQWSPTEQISTDGNSKLGGSQEASTTLLINFIIGFHRHIAKVFKSIVLDILRFNNFKGYSVNLYFPKPEFRNSELDLAIAKEGREAGTISENEHRILCGHEPAHNDELKAYNAHWAKWKMVGKVAPAAPKDNTPEDNTVIQPNEDDGSAIPAKLPDDAPEAVTA